MPKPLDWYQRPKSHQTRGSARASRAFWCAVAVLLLFYTQGKAEEPVRGLWLARQWCASCHQVEPAGTPSSTAPAFATIGKDPATTLAKLHDWLAKPHPPMPDLKLTRVEEDDIFAYILSLKSK